MIIFSIKQDKQKFLKRMQELKKKEIKKQLEKRQKVNQENQRIAEEHKAKKIKDLENSHEKVSQFFALYTFIINHI